MLNYIWLSLIVVGILAAAGRDIYDDVQNTYGNGIPFLMSTTLTEIPSAGSTLRLKAMVSNDEFEKHFLLSSASTSTEFAITLYMRNSNTGAVVLALTENSPEIMKTMSAAQGGKNTVTGRCTITRVDSFGQFGLSVVFEPVHFIFLKKITTAAFDAAAMAVQIAIGLIGIMALWLGMMKVAEEAGLIRVLARVVKPITIRLFPDVPPEHPAIGSIMMNIAANMLGLGNAATPFGLKAMEELNKINAHVGQASNAMVTFLAMNTSCITLIPATAIAVRAVVGSSDPARIIGPTLLASLTATICGVVISKAFQRWRLFKPSDEEKE